MAVKVFPDRLDCQSRQGFDTVKAVDRVLGSSILSLKVILTLVPRSVGQYL
jgi:hypothetical protein